MNQAYEIDSCYKSLCELAIRHSNDEKLREKDHIVNEFPIIEK